MKQLFMKMLLCACLILVTHALFSSQANILAQSIKVSGKVSDANGESMPGVNIIVKGTTKGVITDISGAYNIEAPNSSSVLIFSFIGYINEEVTVGNQTTIDVTMQEDTKELEEVVVIGYGIQRKSDLTGAIVNVKMDDMKGLPAANLTSALSGRLAGVSIQNNGGGPNAGVRIRIRGTGTLNNNDPLVVIDDIIGGDLNLLNPSDIETMTVLKDASAAAIYGSRAASGVILVKTKRGTSDGGTRVNFGMYYGWDKVSKKIDVLSASQLATIYNEASANDGSTPFPEFANPSAMKDVTNWQDEIFRTGIVQNYNLSVATGGPVSNLNLSFDILNNTGVLLNTFNQRYTLRASSDTKIGKRIKIGETLALSYTNNKGADTRSDNSGIMMMALGMHPDVPVYDAEGKYHGVLSSNYGDLENPVGALERNLGYNHYYRMEGNAYAQLEIIDGLNLKTNGSLMMWSSDVKAFYPIKPEAGRPSSRNGLYQARGLWQKWISETTLNFDKTFGQHRVSAVTGFTLEHAQDQPIDASKQDYDDESEEFWYITPGTTMSGMSGGFGEESMMSVLFRVNYAYAEKYLFGFNMRGDGSSKFADGKRWGYFPSFSAGWRIGQEEFMQNLDWLSDLKIRGSYGSLGNSSIGNYRTYSLYRTGQGDGRYDFGPGGQTLEQGYYAGALANPDIRWETATQSNIGFDAVLLKNSLSFTADYFYKKTKDILVDPPMLGYYGTSGSQMINGATVVNKGIEATISYISERNREFKYDLSLNFTTYRNKVESLGNAVQPIYGPKFRDAFTITKTDIGYPISSFYGYRTNGIFTSDSEAVGYVNSKGERLQPDAVGGDLRFVDVNGDGKIDPDDREMIGNPVPDFTYGLTASFYYKNFDLNFFLQGVQGADVWYGLRYQVGFVGLKYNYLAEVWNRYHSGNTQTDVPRVSWQDKNNNKRPSDYYVENGSYLRLNNLVLGYTFPVQWLSKIGVRQFRVYAAAQNLFTITNYPGYDPELGLEQDSADKEAGVDRGQYPHSRTFSLGLNLSF